MTETSPAPRDVSLDILKGSGCLLMIVAHSNLALRGYQPFAFWGGFAPVLFYAVTGVTAGFQAARYRPRGVLLTYCFMFLLGFSFNRITDPGFLEEINFDIIQLIAIGASVIYLLEYFVSPPAWIYMLFAAAAFYAKFALLSLLQGEIIYGVSSILVPPGIFPLFPWLSIFFLGVFAYRVRNIYNLLFGLLAGGIFYVLLMQGFNLDYENKWDMSIGYFLLCCVLVFAGFFIVRVVPLFRQRAGMGLPIFLGRQSLLFLYVHFPLILYLKDKKIHHNVYVINHNPYLFWILILALTILIMLIIGWLAGRKWIAKPFDLLSTWIILTTLVFTTGIFLPGTQIEYWTEIGLGVLFAAFYPALTNLLKNKRGLSPAKI